MDLLPAIVFLTCWLSSANAHPKNTNVIPKEYYQRQSLPEIPGYIPVYIQHGDEPPAWKSSPVKQKLKGRPSQHRDKLSHVHETSLLSQRPDAHYKPGHHNINQQKRNPQENLRTPNSKTHPQPKRRTSHPNRLIKRQPNRRS